MAASVEAKLDVLGVAALLGPTVPHVALPVANFEDAEQVRWSSAPMDHNHCIKTLLSRTATGFRGAWARVTIKRLCTPPAAQDTRSVGGSVGRNTLAMNVFGMCGCRCPPWRAPLLTPLTHS